jgi:putative membrane protein
MGQHGGWLAGWGWGPGLFTAVLTLLALLAVVLLVWRLAGRERRREALRTLEEQYARGNVDDEEFEARRERLTRERSGPG